MKLSSLEAPHQDQSLFATRETKRTDPLFWSTGAFLLTLTTALALTCSLQ